MKQGHIVKRTAIVTGGAGFVGNVLIKHLEENGYSVTALGRRRPPALSSGGSYFLWRLGQSMPEGARLKDCHFFHLAHDWRQDTAPPEQSLNFRGTKLILEEARAKGTSSFLFASSQLAGCSQSNRYGKIKRACEGLLQGPNEIGARIGFVNGGSWGGSVGSLLVLLKRSKVIPSPSGLASIQPVHVEDVCAALTVLAETGWDGSSPPFLAGADNFRFSVYVRALGKEKLNRKIKTIPIGRGVLIHVGRCFPGYLAERVVGLAALEPLSVAAPPQCKFRNFEEIIERSKQRVNRRKHIREARVILSLLLRAGPGNLILKIYTSSMLHLQKEPLNLPKSKILGNIAIRWRELGKKDRELAERLGYLTRLLERYPNEEGYFQEKKLRVWKALSFLFSIFVDLGFKAVGKIKL